MSYTRAFRGPARRKRRAGAGVRDPGEMRVLLLHGAGLTQKIEASTYPPFSANLDVVDTVVLVVVLALVLVVVIVVVVVVVMLRESAGRSQAAGACPIARGGMRRWGLLAEGTQPRGGGTSRNVRVVGSRYPVFVQGRTTSPISSHEQPSTEERRDPGSLFLPS